MGLVVDQGSSLAKSPESSFSSSGPMYGINLTPGPSGCPELVHPPTDQGSRAQVCVGEDLPCNHA